MDKVTLSPDENGYSFKDGAEVLRAQLSSGSGRFTRGILNAAIALNVQWTCDEEEYDYLMAAHAQHVSEGYAPFPIDLIIDDTEFVEHQVRILPGSFGLSAHTGKCYTVKATLEVRPTPKTLFEGTIPKLTLPPDKLGYTFTMESAGHHQPLDGGLGRVYRDQIGVTTKINVKWTTGIAGFLYLRNFYRQWVTKPDMFPMDLVLHTHEMTEHNVWFVPGSMGVDSINGHTFVISAQIEVEATEELEPGGCDCSTTMWQANFEAEFGNIETTTMPMAFGQGELYTPYWNLAIDGDGPLYGDRSLHLGGTSGDQMYFFNPSTTSTDVWTIRFSVEFPADLFAATADLNLLTTYNFVSSTATLRLDAIPDVGGGFRLRVQNLVTEEEWTSSLFAPSVYDTTLDIELNYGYGVEEAGAVRLFVNGASYINAESSASPDGLSEIYWLDNNVNGIAFRWDEMRVVNYVEHTAAHTVSDLPFCVCIEEDAGPWLYFNTHDEAESAAPIYQSTGGGYIPLTAAGREPFVHNTSVTNNDGSDANEQYIMGASLWIPLYYAGLGGGDDGSLPTIPVQGTHYSWEPADPESPITPAFSLDNPSDGAWEGATHYLHLVGWEGVGDFIGWGGGVLTLYRNNDMVDGGNQITIITFLPSGFLYPPLSIAYGPLS